MQTKSAESVFTIGVDLGGTTTSFAIVDSSGKIIAKELISTRTSSVDEWADNLSCGIEKLIVSSGIGGNIKGIGIGAPCANAVTGCIEAATDLPWKSPIPLAEMMIFGCLSTLSICESAVFLVNFRFGKSSGWSPLSI